jgi:hypothetical protein
MGQLVGFAEAEVEQNPCHSYFRILQSNMDDCFIYNSKIAPALGTPIFAPNSCCGLLTVGLSCDSKNKISSIDFQNKGYTGSIPPEIGQLDQLQSINLSGNKYSNAIPTEIGNLANLKLL